MKALSSVIKGGVNVYINGKLVASKHNNVTASFILSLVKAIIGVPSIYSGYFEMPKNAVVKLRYQNTPVTSATILNVSFTEEIISGVEHTRIIYSFSDASRTKYEFDSLQLWTTSTHSLLSHISDASLNVPLIKRPQDVVQIDWWLEMASAQPFSSMLQYLQQQQATYCQSSCDLNLVLPNLTYGYSVFNVYFVLFALPNILKVAKDIKTPLTTYLVQRLTQASDVEPLGITNIVCYDICNCQVMNSPASGFTSEYIGDDYVYVAYNFENPCPSGQYVIPITTLSLGNNYIAQFAIAPVPSSGTGKSALLVKVPYGNLTLENLFTHQGE
jgi:hypothetical protein